MYKWHRHQLCHTFLPWRRNWPGDLSLFALQCQENCFPCSHECQLYLVQIREQMSRSCLIAVSRYMGHREPKCWYPSETSVSKEVKIAISSPEKFQFIDFFLEERGWR